MPKEAHLKKQRAAGVVESRIMAEDAGLAESFDKSQTFLARGADHERVESTTGPACVAASNVDHGAAGGGGQLVLDGEDAARSDSEGGFERFDA